MLAHFPKLWCPILNFGAPTQNFGAPSLTWSILWSNGKLALKFGVGAPEFRVGAPEFRVGAPKFGTQINHIAKALKLRHTCSHSKLAFYWKLLENLILEQIAILKGFFEFEFLFGACLNVSLVKTQYCRGKCRVVHNGVRKVIL